ncbi:MAG: DUF3267 domain-containing protein [Bacteroidota bacterium]
MNPSSDELRSDPRFHLLDELEFVDMVRFIMDKIRTPSFITRFFWSLHLLYLTVVFFLSATYLSAPRDGSSHFIWLILAGFALGSVAVVPFHEGLHALTYRFTGAKKIKFGADFRQMIFFVSADNYVISGRQLVVVALAPFVVINLTVLISLFFMDIRWQILSMVFLLSHNVMCLGDFAMVNYVYHHRYMKIYTFDLTGEKKSYIYGLSKTEHEER